jgi:hypothetical protein
LNETVANARLTANINDPVQIRSNDLDDLSKMILHVNELKMELAKLVNVLTSQAKKEIESL